MTTPDPTRDAPTAAVVAEPEDDLPRLACADWLEENGEPARAECSRVQCRLARMNDWDEGHVEARLREQRLFAEHFQDWSQPLRGVEGAPGGWQFGLHQFRRGFPDLLRFSDD